MLFMAFHGKPHFDAQHPPHESPVVVTAPLVLLAIPSVAAGWVIGPVVFGDYFQGALPKVEEEYHGIWAFMAHGFVSIPFWLAIAGIVTAWYLYLKRPALPKRIAMELGPLYALVERKYGFDELYAWLFGGGARTLGKGFWRGGGQAVTDGRRVIGSARGAGLVGSGIHRVPTGLG